MTTFGIQYPVCTLVYYLLPFPYLDGKKSTYSLQYRVPVPTVLCTVHRLPG